MECNVSVLLSVYNGDDPVFLDEALYSLYNQSIKFNELVIVKDGPLNNELQQKINSWESELPIKIVDLEENCGLGAALGYGLLACSNNLVARMDSDDICDLKRIETQFNYMSKHPEITVLGGQIEEFHSNPNQIRGKRVVPLDHDNIVRRMKTRNGINHVTVMFRKDDILKVGNYQSMMYFEDYFLWIKLILNGFKLENMAQTLVKVRIGNDMITRRIGLNYLKYEYRFFTNIFKLGFLSKLDYAKVFFLRFPLRLVPKNLLELIYKIILR